MRNGRREALGLDGTSRTMVALLWMLMSGRRLTGKLENPKSGKTRAPEWQV